MSHGKGRRGGGIVNIKSSLFSEPWKGEEGRWYSQRKEFIVL